jgi:hypothetical protein
MIRAVTQSLYVLLRAIFLLGGIGVLLLGTGLLPTPVRDVILSIGEDNLHKRGAIGTFEINAAEMMAMRIVYQFSCVWSSE